MTRLWPVRPFALDAGPSANAPIRILAEAVAQQHGYTLADLRAHDESVRTTNVRREVARVLTAKDYSLVSVGKILDRNHTTVAYYLDRYRPREKRGSNYSVKDAPPGHKWHWFTEGKLSLAAEAAGWRFIRRENGNKIRLRRGAESSVLMEIET